MGCSAMRSLISFITAVALSISLSGSSSAATSDSIQTPSQFLGFEVGADRKLADYHQIVSYMKYLASKSARIQVESMGSTTLNNEFILAAISSKENLQNKNKYQEIARKLADPRGRSEEEINALVKQGKVILLVTCNIHSTEIASSQMAMEWAHALVTAEDPETVRRLNNVILLLVPSLNPDGQIMVTDWYRKYVGTKYEGGRMPWLYHAYVGHDDNRDWYMLTQKETQAMTHAAYHEWFPQIWLDEHQMGSVGPRLFVPPYTDPIANSVSPLMWRGINVIGATMAWRLEQEHKSGVVYGYIYDQYWPGATEGTPQFKNIFGLLTEAASARVATPVTLSQTELSGGGKGLTDYMKTANFPNPWPGGTWRMRDIMDYERIASDATLETASYHHDDFLRGTEEMAKEQIAEGKADEFWKIRRDQRDPVTVTRLAHLLDEHGAEVDVSQDGKEFLIPTAQPYGRFVAELMGLQRYPKVRVAPGQPILRPYDVTAWSLPLLMGVQVSKEVVPESESRGARKIGDSDWPEGRIEGGSSVYALSPQTNNSTRLLNAALKAKESVSVATEGFAANGVKYPAGTLLIQPAENLKQLASQYHVVVRGLDPKPNVPAAALKEVRVGLYKSWNASMDEGWTRWLLEQYGFNLKSIDTKTMKAGSLNAAFDAIILPDMDKNVIVDGRRKPQDGAAEYFEDLPPEYSGGIGKEGVKALKDFVEGGGTLITLAESGELPIDEFNLPVHNALARVRPEEFSSPGSLLRLNLDPTNPIAYGMPDEVAAFVSEPIAYQTEISATDIQRSVLAWYPTDSEDILMSGWLNGGDRLARHAAAVTLTYGKGKIVLFGFRVQNRAQTEATFKMLFNAIQWAGME
jgi:hypothetical protein